LLLAAIAGALTSLAQPAHSQGAPHYYVCSTRDAARKVAYVSGVFADKPGDVSQVEASWKEMLKSKYGETHFPSASCSEATTSAVAETMRGRLNEFASDEGEKITPVAWSYKPSAAASAKPSTTASSPFAADAENAKGWCEYNMPQIRSLFTCDCFAKMVLHHREKYPNEIETQKGSTRMVPFQSLMVGSPTRLDCAECMTDEHIAKWVEDMLDLETIVMKRVGRFDQAKLDAFAACIRKGFKERILAEPYVDRVIPFYNLTAAACAGSRP
jgi:hypothetical protein